MTINLSEAAYAYGTNTPVFRNLSFHLETGSIMSIIGPNGCGKTTLLKCLVGIRPFSEGIMEIDDMQGLKEADKSRLFGYVPQLTADPVPYPVERMVLLGRARFMGPFSRPDPQDFEVTRKAMEMVGISGLVHRGFHTLSGGERQLVLIAQAIATEARTLVFDEPTSALDLVNQHDTIELLRELSHNRGYTIIFSSHDPSHALHISDMCLMMDRGDNYRFGSTGAVITEEGLRRVFGIDSRIIRHQGSSGEYSMGVLPILKPYAHREEAVG